MTKYFENGFNLIARYLEVIGKDYERKLYRGHADLTWEPVPSAFREGAKGLITTDQLQRWKMMAQRLEQMPDELHWLVLAQHFGIPTPLLDWTMNPLIALFFAVEANVNGKGGVVLAVPFKSFEFAEHTLMVNPFRKDRTSPLLFDTSAMNARSAAQDSYMTLHPRDLPEAISYHEVFNITEGDKLSVQTALSVLGLTPERIYPDLGVAAHQMNSWLITDHAVGISDIGKRPDY